MSGSGKTDDSDRRFSDEPLRVAGRARLDVTPALRAAANSLHRTAVTHERAAKSFERIAAVSPQRVDLLHYASRHRYCAYKDRLFAQQVSKWAENAATRPLPNALAFGLMALAELPH